MTVHTIIVPRIQVEIQIRRDTWNKVGNLIWKNISPELGHEIHMGMRGSSWNQLQCSVYSKIWVLIQDEIQENMTQGRRY